jgi:hypothetical protein
MGRVRNASAIWATAQPSTGELVGRFIKMKLAHVKKERKPERYANQKTADNRKPESPHTEATAFCKNKNPQHKGRNDDIKAEEAPDTVCKQVTKEKREIQSVVQKPRHELPIRQEHAENAQS